MVVDFALSEIGAAASQFLSHLGDSKVIAFRGGMGVGKTTFINALCEKLRVKSRVSSPTFSIINEYQTENGEQVYHIDLYRLSGVQEAVNAGVEDVFYSGMRCFVEWPERCPELFPPDTLYCGLTMQPDNRRRLEISL